MKHSIKNQFAIIFIGLMTGTIVLCWFLNTTLLERYYINNKKNVLLSAYYSINAASNVGDMDSDEYKLEIQKICGRYNIDILTINEDSEPVTSSVHETFPLLRELMDKVFGIKSNWPDDREKNTDELLPGDTEDRVDDSNVEKPEVTPKEESEQNEKEITYILEETADYTIENSFDLRTKSRYIQMWGYLDNGNPFLIRSAVEGIQDSVHISNQFLAYIGILMAILSGIVVWLVSHQITKPILQLADLSKRMTNLDFDAKYTGKSNNEIGVLGQHMNQMADTLEETISELKTANNELEHDLARKEKIDEMRSEFVANVSHELKTPLALIMGYAEGLKDCINDDAESRDFYCDVIMDEAERMNVMVKKLLTLNQLEFGNEKITMERFDLVAMIRNYLSSADILVKQAGATVSFDETEPIYAWGDEFKIEEVFMNYFTNALNHVDGEKKIQISILKKDGIVRVSVYNTGMPIPGESIDHLWEKFYKVDKARTREYGGSGVGLSIVKAIMESMNQSYGVENKEDGVEFWFELESK